MCALDSEIVSQAASTLEIISRNPKQLRQLRFDGTEWVQYGTFNSGGSQLGNKIWVNRGAECEKTKEVIYHEAWHSNQPSTMNSRDKEIDAYFNTELWSIARGYAGRPSLRTTNYLGDPIPNTTSIETFVGQAYGYVKGTPRIYKRVGNTVFIEGGITREAGDGDMINEEIEEERCERRIDPSKLVCPHRP